MNVRKFIAANARDALHKVKETLGADAIILSNRGVPGGVEIMAVAARDMAMIVPTPVTDQPSIERRKAQPAGPSVDAEDDYHVSLSVARGQLSAQANRAATSNNAATRPPAAPAMTAQKSARVVNAGIPKPQSLRNLEAARAAAAAAEKTQTQSQAPAPVQTQGAATARLETPASVLAEPIIRNEAEVIPASVMEEIRSLRKIVEQHLAGFAWGEAARSAPAKTEVLRQMLDAGFSPLFARELLEELPSGMSAAEAMAWVKGAAERSLFTLNPEADIVDRGGVYALVGPTGVGKTTTTAKLAARCVLKHGPSKVALVTTDGYRIGAHEQLRIYGRILGVSVYLVKDTAELQQTLAELRHKHLVLIDTMGMSQKDRLVPELTGMLAGCDVRRLLLLSATSRGDTLDDVVRAYNGPDLAGCILTKVDEAASLATSLDVIMRHRLRLHYVSNGQRVPEDLHLPNRPYLLHRAFKDLPEASPHRFDGMEPALMMANAGLVAVGGGHG